MTEAKAEVKNCGKGGERYKNREGGVGSKYKQRRGRDIKAKKEG